MAINQVILEGTVGSVSPNEKGNYVYVSLAHDVYYKQDDKEIKETHWFGVSLFNGAAKWVLENVKKGDRVLVMGRLSSERYEKDGEQVASLRIIARTVRVTARKGEKASEAPAPTVSESVPDFDA